MNTPIIDVAHLRKAFGAHEVLRDVRLQIPAGAVVGLIGANGAGKTTLIKCLLGLLEPTAGTAKLFGQTAWDLDAATKARLSYVPQEVALYPWMRVQQVVDYTGAFYPNWDRAWAQQLIQRWALPPRHLVKTLSTGQLQKLALVLGMGHRPELMLLDEPVASLDPVGRREFLRSVLELQANHVRTVLFSTHITSDLERIATHVAILRDGRMIHFDEMDNLKDCFKRLRIRASCDLPTSFHVAGALRVAVDGSTALVAMPHVTQTLLTELRASWDADVIVEDLNLEEIFVELHDA